MGVRRNFLKNTQTNPGTGGSVYDLSDIPDTAATFTYTTNSATYVAVGFQMTISDLITSTSFPTSISIASVTAGSPRYRWRLQRYNSSNTLQASSAYSAVFTGTGIKIATLIFSTTWAYGDRLRFAFEYSRPSGGSATFALDVNNTSSYVDYDYRRIFAVS